MVEVVLERLEAGGLEREKMREGMNRLGEHSRRTLWETKVERIRKRRGRARGNDR